MVNPYSECLGLYGGGADDLVERRGGGGIPSVNLMEELLGSLIPPRSNMSLLVGCFAGLQLPYVTLLSV